MNNKKGTIALIVILSIIACALTGGFIYLLNNSSNLNFDFHFNLKPLQMELIDSYENTVDSVNKIYLNLYSTDVEINKSSDEKIKVEYYSNQKKNAKTVYDNGTISVDETKYDVSCVGFCNVRRKVVLSIPEDYVGEYDIKTKSGDVKSNIDLVNNILTISLMSGDVKINAVGDANITTISGNISIDSISKKAMIRATSGNIRIANLNIIESSSISTTSGDVSIQNNNSGCYVNAKAISGDVKVATSDRKSDLVLDINTTSGDININ